MNYIYYIVIVFVILSLYFYASTANRVDCQVAIDEDQIEKPSKPSKPRATPEIDIPRVQFFNQQIYTDGINILNYKLDRTIFGDQIIFSPISITYPMGILTNWAREQSTTASELINLFGHQYTVNELLNLSNKFVDDQSFKMANIILLNNNFKYNKKYIDAAGTVAKIEYSDNPAAMINRVNTYVESFTNNLIKNFLDSSMVSPDLSIILLNIIYYKSNWKTQFEASDTTQQTFYRAMQTKSTVDLMYQKNAFAYFENNFFQALEMSYQDPNYRFGVYLPKIAWPETSSLIMTLDIFNNLIPNMRQVDDIHLYLPKFTQRSKNSLVKNMKTLGVNKIFSPDAEFNIAPQTYVSDIIHEAVVIVDEKGTEAAAATAVIMKQYSAGPSSKPTIIFRADHTFTYWIRYVPLNIILFFGHFDG